MAEKVGEVTITNFEESLNKLVENIILNVKFHTKNDVEKLVAGIALVEAGNRLMKEAMQNLLDKMEMIKRMMNMRGR